MRYTKWLSALTVLALSLALAVPSAAVGPSREPSRSVEGTVPMSIPETGTTGPMYPISMDPTLTPPAVYKAPRLKKGLSKKAAKRFVTKERPFKIRFVKIKNKNWKYYGKAVAWSQNTYTAGSVVTVYIGRKPPKPKHHDDGHSQPKTTRALINWHLHNRGCYSKRIENMIFKYCFQMESGCRPVAGGPGSCRGAGQYLDNWKCLTKKHVCKDKRKSGQHRDCLDWAVWRCVRGYDLLGEAFLDKHWVNWP